MAIIKKAAKARLPRAAAATTAATALIMALLFLFQLAQTSADTAAGENAQSKLVAKSCALNSGGSSLGTYASACAGTYPGNCAAAGDRVSCNDSITEAPTATNNKYRGVNISVFNDTIISCVSITKVMLCYRWWATAGDTMADCHVSVDTSGGASWTEANTTCPGTAAGANLICTDVTANETWTCTSFFGASTTKAYARAEHQRTSSGAATAVNIDVLYFNVTYVASTPPNTTIVAPKANSNFSGNFLINASINDTTGMALANSVNATIFNTTGNATGRLPMTLSTGTTTSGYWTVTFDSSTLRDGWYNISVNATNTAGKINRSDNVSIKIDNTKSNATIEVPVNGTNASGMIVINASVNDSPSGVFKVAFRIINSTASTQWFSGNLSSGSITQGYWNYTFNSTTVVDGDYNISINATDFAGNQLIVNISAIKIDNIAPVIRRVLLPQSIFLIPGLTTFVTCNATVEDDNGPANVHRVNATFYATQRVFNSPDDNNDHYTNSSCEAISAGVTKIQQNFTCGFDMFYYANNASWTCNVTATASITKTNSTTNTTTVNELIAMSLNTSTIDYGNLSVTQTSNEFQLNISNFGNVPINITVKGFGWNNETRGENLSMMCERGNISVGNERYSNISTANWATMINLTSNATKITNLTLPQRLNDAGPGNDTNTTFWRIKVPLGVGGLCNGTIQYGATVT